MRVIWRGKGFPALGTAVLLVVQGICMQAIAEVRNNLVYRGPDQRLVYTVDPQGNTLPDFSNAGFRGGGVAIPDVGVKITLHPADGLDDQRVQAALDELAELPEDESGFRGALRLSKGEYEIEGSLKIRASGIVLRGDGQGTDGTVLRAVGTEQRALIDIQGVGRWSKIEGTTRSIEGDYIPVGARILSLSSSAGLGVGDRIIVRRLGSEKWISDIGMDKIPPRPDGKSIRQWDASEYVLDFERVITAVSGNTITIDAPVMNAMEAWYGGGEIFRYEFDGRISNVGVEDLRLISSFVDSTDEEHAWDAVLLDRLENAWVRRVMAAHFGYSLVNIGRGAIRTTVEDCVFLDPVSKITGSRRYSFVVAGQYSLVQRCYARNGRHDFVTHSRVPGPNVFLDCLAEQSHSDIGPHHRWAVGTLYDNVEGNKINVQDRGYLGSGHGWSGAQQVLWNCVAESIICHKPPTAQNYCIGCIGLDGSPRFQREDCHWASRGRHVEPRSLYLAQLRDRLGDEAVLNIATERQLAGKTRDDLRLSR